MGSDSDWPVVKSACTVLKDFGVPYEAHILSAHRAGGCRRVCQVCPRQWVRRNFVRCRYGRTPGRCLCRQHHPAGHRHPDEGRRDGRPGRHCLPLCRCPAGSVATVALNGAKERRLSGRGDPGCCRRRAGGESSINSAPTPPPRLPRRTPPLPPGCGAVTLHTNHKPYYNKN